MQIEIILSVDDILSADRRREDVPDDEYDRLLDAADCYCVALRDVLALEFPYHRSIVTCQEVGETTIGIHFRRDESVDDIVTLRASLFEIVDRVRLEGSWREDSASDIDTLDRRFLCRCHFPTISPCSLSRQVTP